MDDVLLVFLTSYYLRGEYIQRVGFNSVEIYLRRPDSYLHNILRRFHGNREKLRKVTPRSATSVLSTSIRIKRFYLNPSHFVQGTSFFRSGSSWIWIGFGFYHFRVWFVLTRFFKRVVNIFRMIYICMHLNIIERIRVHFYKKPMIFIL